MHDSVNEPGVGAERSPDDVTTAPEGLAFPQSAFAGRRALSSLEAAGLVVLAAGCALLLLVVVALAYWVLGPTQAFEQFVDAVGIWGAALLAILGVAAWFSLRELSAQLATLTQSLDEMGRGVPGPFPAVGELDEIGELTVACAELQVVFAARLEKEREARRAAQHADREKTDLFQSISHALKTPLNSILGFSNVLLNEIDGELTYEQREDLGIVRSSGEHLNQLFDEVLDTTGESTRRFRVSTRPVAIKNILTAVAGELRGQLGEKPVTIRVDVDDELGESILDPTRTRQMVANLAFNALRYTDRGEIRLSAFLEQGWLRIDVADTGTGIAEENLQTIFEEHRRLDPRRGGGLGLGLAITKQLALLHGGEVKVHSQPGRGSTFSLLLPWRAP